MTLVKATSVPCARGAHTSCRPNEWGCGCACHVLISDDANSSSTDAALLAGVKARLSTALVGDGFGSAGTRTVDVPSTSTSRRGDCEGISAATPPAACPLPAAAPAGPTSGEDAA